MHTSATPRLLSCDSTVSQNLLDSPVVGPTHIPSTFLTPSQSIPRARYTGRFATTPSRILVLSLILLCGQFHIMIVDFGIMLGVLRRGRVVAAPVRSAHRAG